MQIVQNLSSISVNTEDCEFFNEVKRLILKNFSKNIGKKSKLISFYNENELIQRRYFLKFLSILNRKMNNEELKNINNAHYKTIKLKLESINTLQVIINCELDFKGRRIIFNFDKLEKNLELYIKNYFKQHSIDVLKNKLIIEYEDERTLNLLDNFCSFNNHLRYCINFTLNELSYLEFKKNIDKHVNANNRFLNICRLFEEHFKTLELEIGASFEEVRAKYLKLSKCYHPDFHMEKSDEVKKILKKKFEEVHNAYENLKYLYSNAS